MMDWFLLRCTCWLDNFSQQKMYTVTLKSSCVSFEYNLLCLINFTATTKGLWAATTLCPHADRQCTAINSRILWWYSFRDPPYWCVNTAMTWVNVAMGFCCSTCSMLPVANKPDEWGFPCTYNCTMSGCYQNLSMNVVNFRFSYRYLISSYFISTAIPGVDLGGDGGLVGWLATPT